MMLYEPPPARLETMLSQVQTLQIAAISAMSVTVCLLLALFYALHRVGATIREFMGIFIKPGVPSTTIGQRIGNGSEKGDC